MRIVGQLDEVVLVHLYRDTTESVCESINSLVRRYEKGDTVNPFSEPVDIPCTDEEILIEQHDELGRYFLIT